MNDATQPLPARRRRKKLLTIFRYFSNYISIEPPLQGAPRSYPPPHPRNAQGTRPDRRPDRRGFLHDGAQHLLPPRSPPPRPARLLPQAGAVRHLFPRNHRARRLVRLDSRLDEKRKSEMKTRLSWLEVI